MSHEVEQKYESTPALETLRTEERLHLDLHVEQSILQIEVLGITSLFNLVIEPTRRGMMYEKSPTRQETCNTTPQSLHV